MRSLPWPKRSARVRTADADEVRRKNAAEVARKREAARWRGWALAHIAALRVNGHEQAASDLERALAEMRP